jgi:O-antigen ligase
MFAVLVACGFVGIATFAVTFGADQIANRADVLIPLQGQAAGLYMSLAIAWIGARVTHGVPTPRWLIALLPIGLTLMFLTTQRSVWIIAILSLGIVAILAPGEARRRAVLATPAVLVATFAVAVGVQALVNATLGGVEARTQTTMMGDESESGGEGTPQLANEVTSLSGGESAESENMTWRLAYWKEIVERTPEAPVLGVGFGQPTAFVWEGRKYDFRDGEPGSGLDVAGPHNSFVSWLYRLGVPAALALLFVLFVAARNTWRGVRSAETGDRVALVTLAAMLGSGIGVSLFNEALTGPFLGLFFWAPLAMLLLWPAFGPRSGRAAAPPTG